MGGNTGIVGIGGNGIAKDSESDGSPGNAILGIGIGGNTGIAGIGGSGIASDKLNVGMPGKAILGKGIGGNTGIAGNGGNGIASGGSTNNGNAQLTTPTLFLSLSMRRSRRESSPHLSPTCSRSRSSSRRMRILHTHRR